MFCPECRAEIDHLSYSADYTEWGKEYGRATIEGDIDYMDERSSNDSETTDIEYECPECGATLCIEDLLEDLPDDEEEEDEEKEERTDVFFNNLFKDL